METCVLLNVGKVRLKNYIFPLRCTFAYFSYLTVAYVFLKYMVDTKSFFWRFPVLYMAFKKCALLQKTEC